jgi:hypothetical protein
MGHLPPIRAFLLLVFAVKKPRGSVFALARSKNFQVGVDVF